MTSQFFDINQDDVIDFRYSTRVKFIVSPKTLPEGEYPDIGKLYDNDEVTLDFPKSEYGHMSAKAEKIGFDPETKKLWLVSRMTFQKVEGYD